MRLLIVLFPNCVDRAISEMIFSIAFVQMSLLYRHYVNALKNHPPELEQLVDLLLTRITGQESQNLTDMILETLKRDLLKSYTWPGNVRELEQAMRRILLTRHYGGDVLITGAKPEEEFMEKIRAGTLEGVSC